MIANNSDLKDVQVNEKVNTDTYEEVKTKVDGPTERRVVYSWEDPSTELEFYIPAAIWSNVYVRDFVRKFPLIPFPDGATVIKSTVGFWEGGTEDTHILRVIVRRAQLDRIGLRRFAQNQISRLTADLSGSEESKQKTVIFTDQELVVSSSSLERPATPKEKQAEHPKLVTSKHIPEGGQLRREANGAS